MECKFPLFEVPIIAPDMLQEETLLQIADTLDYLQKITDIVFDSINKRVSENKRRISQLSDRASSAKQKVDKLTGITKATQIFSTAKYPASEIHKDYKSIFSHVDKLYFTANFSKNTSNPVSVERQSLEEKLQFYHVKSVSVSHKDNINIPVEEGLGNLPYKIETVSSLLLFNTSENPYKKYVTLDPMGVVAKPKKNFNNEEPQQMEAAPLSITQQQQLDSYTKENYFYSPSLGDVPNLDVPLDLPDLPGIADDLKYNSDLGPGFAPSVTTTPAVPDLPVIPEQTFENITSKQVEMDVPQNVVLPQVTPPPPPPPPPPSPPAPPPPPPPPPPSKATVSEVCNDKIVMINKTYVAQSSDDARANLMAAIRNAGGVSKLKSVHDRKDEARMQRDTKASGGDLMADLRTKLSMRRKGISGGDENMSVGSAMEKISAMIPPPAQQDASSTTEDEWDE